MALQACPNNAPLHFLSCVSCLLDQILYNQHTCGVIGIMNEISCVVRGLSSPSSNARPVSHGKYEQKQVLNNMIDVNPDRGKRSMTFH
jgi:hypothetical protein